MKTTIWIPMLIAAWLLPPGGAAMADDLDELYRADKANQQATLERERLAREEQERKDQIPREEQERQSRLAREEQLLRETRAALEAQPQAAEPQYDPCSHVYVGKVFEARGGVFGFKQDYEVLGYSSNTGRATVAT